MELLKNYGYVVILLKHAIKIYYIRYTNEIYR